MDRAERFGDFNTMVLKALRSWQTGLWTAMPGFIATFDPVKMTAEVRLAIQWEQTDREGNVTWEDF